jgi:F-type H+-transporting ATPase subunit gamma
MASLRDIRRRIKSVKNTRQITKALELVAASKMKKAQQSAIAGRAYAILMVEMLAAVAGRVEESQHPFLVRREVKTRGIILVSSDMGLCGALNTNVFRLVTEVKTPAKYAVIGRKGAQFIARTKRNLLAEFKVSDKVTFPEVRTVAEFTVKQFLDGNVDTVEVFYPRFKNTLVQVPTAVPLLPLESLASVLTNLRVELGLPPADAANVDHREILFEPEASVVLETLLPRYVYRAIHQFVLNAKASEHSSRMVAMKTAKDNATKLIGDLTLEYNKARQAGITQEILEIAAASFATG